MVSISFINLTVFTQVSFYFRPGYLNRITRKKIKQILKIKNDGLRFVIVYEFD